LGSHPFGEGRAPPSEVAGGGARPPLDAFWGGRVPPPATHFFLFNFSLKKINFYLFLFFILIDTYRHLIGSNVAPNEICQKF
jgi:hypothetical protein